MEHWDSHSKRITRFLYKWLWCSWIHRKDRCYPEVWDRGLDGPWHCLKCHDCGEAYGVIIDGQKMKWF